MQFRSRACAICRLLCVQQKRHRALKTNVSSGRCQMSFESRQITLKRLTAWSRCIPDNAFASSFLIRNFSCSFHAQILSDSSCAFTASISSRFCATRRSACNFIYNERTTDISLGWHSDLRGAKNIQQLRRQNFCSRWTSIVELSCK